MNMKKQSKVLKGVIDIIELVDTIKAILTDPLNVTGDKIFLVNKDIDNIKCITKRYLNEDSPISEYMISEGLAMLCKNIEKNYVIEEGKARLFSKNSIEKDLDKTLIQVIMYIAIEMDIPLETLLLTLSRGLIRNYPSDAISYKDGKLNIYQHKLPPVVYHKEYLSYDLPDVIKNLYEK